eukprot:TRINITY_DN7169_c0_g2_i1.p1 TRINITY_DN7169_c0_g2~~TRINITY_DN7169_c0_g2_i1.p1  ORF type:complete len:282 (+),score=45.05 TRINITY_DN7169_c0_g2_i1:74-919(+)
MEASQSRISGDTTEVYPVSTKGNSGSRNPACKVFVGQLPYSVTWKDLKDHFSKAGTVTYSRILMDKGQVGGRSANPDGWSKGMALVEYATPQEAANAVAVLSGSVLGTRSLSVEPWIDYGRPPPQAARGDNFSGCTGKGVKAKGGVDVGKNWANKHDTWASSGKSWGITLSWETKGKGKGGGKSNQSRNPACKVFVGQLAYSTTWQELTQHFSQVGTVTYSKIIMEQGKGKGWNGANPDGWSKGMGIVEFSTPAEAQLAIATLSGSILADRQLVVDEWKYG